MTAVNTIYAPTRSAERLRRTPVRIWPAAWWSLYFNARFDARSGIPFIDVDAQPQTVTTKTAVITRIKTRADEYATVEGLRFKVAVDAQWTHWEAATKELARLRRLADELERANPHTDADQEQARRLQRRILTTDHVLAPLASIINARFTVAQLRTSRLYDHADQLASLYWRTLRRHTGTGLNDVPPELERPEWLSSRNGITVLEQWNTTATATTEEN